MGALREARSQLAAERTPDPPDGTAPPAAEQAGRCTAARRQAVSLAALTATHCRSLGRDGPATVPGGYLDTPPRRYGHTQDRAHQGVRPHPGPGHPQGVGPHPEPGTPRGWAAAMGALRDAQSQLAAERRSEEHTSELQSRGHLVCRLLLEKKIQNT